MDIKRYTPQEILDYFHLDKTDKAAQAKFQREGFRCLGAGERGMGGLSRTAKFIPESIHIIISPLACQRHCDFDLRMNNYTDGVYSLFLTEQEIVGGRVVETLKREILKLLERRSPMPKVITITVTCVDGLIRSDYAGLERMLMEEYGIRFGVVEMFPILADNRIKHTDKFPHMVYGRIHADPKKEKKKLINLIGKIDPVDTSTDFYTVLNAAGYEVREIRQCRTLAEFDEMGEACLNVVLSAFNLHAAKMMEKKYGISYFFWNQHMDHNTIRANYTKLEELLGCKLDVEAHHRAAAEKAEEVRKLADGKTFAMGPRLDYIPVKAACDMIAMGINVVSVFVDKFDKADRPYYEWLRDHKPDIQIYLTPDIGMREFMQHPDPVDVAISGILALKQVPGLQTLALPEEPYDFGTYCQMMERIIQQLQPKATPQPATSQPVENPFARQWRSFPKGVL